MNNFTSVTKKLAIHLVVLVQIAGVAGFGFTSIALASETPAPGNEASVTYAPCPTVTGASAPTGSAAATYVFNPASCKWENSYYRWDPVTRVTTALYDQTPILNSAGTAWEYTEWYFSPAAGTYKSRTISIPVPQQAPQTPESVPQNATGGTPANYSGGPIGNGSNYNNSSTISNTGPYSGNSINGNNVNDINYNLNNSTGIFTGLNSYATSGNAFVMGNNTGGNATSGDANAAANYLNMIQSAWLPSLGPVSTFNASLQGSHFGDILFNPDAVIRNTGTASDNSVANNADNNLNITSTTDSTIVNDINIGSTSGDATVSQNTNGGNASTGDATAVANIINMINSRIASGGSFIGNVDIHGNLDGDILLPASILAMLKNTGYGSNNSIANNANTNMNVNVDKNNSIINNVDLAAQSGTALVDSNTNAGSATSGDANTSLKQANIVGANANGTKGLLVFVNVLGKWTGMLWDGTGLSSIQGTGPESNNSIANNSNTDINADFTQNNTIVNNLDLRAQSGDASVVANTNAGSATSGDAYAGANILNMIDSNVNFTDWFGILFINVFGSWNGSFGTDTAAGNKPKPTGGAVLNNSASTSSNSANGSSSNSSASASTSSSLKSVSRLASSISGSTGATQSTQPESKPGVTSSTSTSTPSIGGTVGSATTAGNASSSATFVWGGIVLASLVGLIVLNRSRLVAGLKRS